MTNRSSDQVQKQTQKNSEKRTNPNRVRLISEADSVPDVDEDEIMEELEEDLDMLLRILLITHLQLILLTDFTSSIRSTILPSSHLHRRTLLAQSTGRTIHWTNKSQSTQRTSPQSTQ